MTDRTSISRQIVELFANEFQLEIPTPDIDLIAEGLLDSLVFVDLIMHLERTFETTIAIEDLELDQFRTVAQMADFLLSRKAALVAA